MRASMQERLDSLRLRGAVGLIVAAAVTLAFVAALLERLIDPDAFTSFGEALWFTIVTVSTVGYGDIVPGNTAGKVVAAGLMLLGLALIPLLTSVVVSILSGQRARAEREIDRQQFDRLVQLLQRLDERLDRLEQRVDQH
jgi:voltage-gated potassium channel